MVQGMPPGFPPFTGFPGTGGPSNTPRNPNDPDGMLEQMLNQMMMSIGGRGLAGGAQNPLGIFAPAFGGQFGDAVYSQEALDRIVTQLMEQNQAGHAPGPATEAAIASLPTRKITEEDQAEDTKKAECSICMDEAGLGSLVTELPCHHWFHGECIKAWLTEHDTCPHCRRGIMAREGNEERARTREEEPLNDMS